MVGAHRLGTRIVRLYIPLAVCMVLMLFPFYWMLITSIKPNRELYSQKVMPLIVHQPTLKHYYDLLSETNFITWTYNTLLVAVVGLIGLWVFIDGLAGLLHISIGCMNSYLKYAKLIELRRAEGR